MSDQLLRPNEAATFLGLSSTTLAKWRSTREQTLPYVKRGNRVFYRQEDLENFKGNYERYIESGPETVQ